MPVRRPVLLPEWKPSSRRLHRAIQRTWSFIRFPVALRPVMLLLIRVVGAIQVPTAEPARQLPIPEPFKQDKTKRILPIHFLWMHRYKSMTDKRLRWKCCQTAAAFLRFTIQPRHIWNTNTRFRPVLCFRATRPIFPLLMPAVLPVRPIILTTREAC